MASSRKSASTEGTTARPSAAAPAALRRRLPDSPYVWRAVGFVERAYAQADDPVNAQHCYEVAAILGPRRSEVVIATGLLHDILEDTDTKLASIRRSFGSSVSDLVDVLSEDPTLDGYGPRKRALRAVVRSARPEAQVVFAADKLAKVRAATRAGRAPAQRRWRHYLASHEMLTESAADRRLVNRLGRELTSAAAEFGLPAPA
jgi:(p)ppGpp synthase/HD superfamily hydrolase